MKNRVIISFLILIICLPTKFYFAQESSGVIINEFMALNSSTIIDPEFSEYSDWIELHNSSGSDYDLTNCFLTDDLQNPAKWKIINTFTLKSGDYVGFWADERDTKWHTNFRLAKEGGFLGLFDKDTILIDSVTYPPQRRDISYGRTVGNLTDWYYFDDPTPGSINSENKFLGFTENPNVLLDNGFYESVQFVEVIGTDNETVIYYTLNGSEPDQNSDIYYQPIQIDKTTVLRAIAVKENYIQSDIISNSYFINERSALPIFSIITDPKNFFDEKIGIYVAGTNGITGLCSNTPKNWNQDWERPIHMEFYESDRSLALKQDAGIKINGGCSRIYPQKSLAIFARNDYGLGTMQHRFFEDRDYDEYKSIILRSSAQDWWRTMFRDGMIQTLLKGNLEIDYQEYRPSIVFLNSEYFGIHNIREKLNKYYIASIHGVDPDNIDLVEISKEVIINEGDDIAYNHMMDFAAGNDLSNAENYTYLQTLMDIDEYIDYYIAEIYAANADWPGSNLKMWRQKSPPGKFRWMIYDLDFGFGGNGEGQYYNNTLELATATNGPDWPNPPWSTLLFRQLLNNESFKNEFIQRFAFHVATTFNPDRVIGIIDSLQSQIASEIPRHKERWEKSVSFADTWDELVEIMREFALKRGEYVMGHFIDKFNLGGVSNLTVNSNNENGGYIFAYNELITRSDYTYEVFNQVPILLKARAEPGYRFTGWSGASTSSDETIELTLDDDIIITANFVNSDSDTKSIVINEINYNSSPGFATGDWVEFVNASDIPIDISGWRFKDSVDSHIFQFSDNIELQTRFVSSYLQRYINI